MNKVEQARRNYEIEVKPNCVSSELVNGQVEYSVGWDFENCLSEDDPINEVRLEKITAFVEEGDATALHLVFPLSLIVDTLIICDTARDGRNCFDQHEKPRHDAIKKDLQDQIDRLNSFTYDSHYSPGVLAMFFPQPTI